MLLDAPLVVFRQAATENVPGRCFVAPRHEVDGDFSEAEALVGKRSAGQSGHTKQNDPPDAKVGGQVGENKGQGTAYTHGDSNVGEEPAVPEQESEQTKQ